MNRLKKLNLKELTIAKILQAKRLSCAHLNEKQGTGEKKKLNLAVFGSKSGTNLQAILRVQKQEQDFQVQVIVTDRVCPCQTIAQNEGIPLIYVSYKKIKEKYPSEYHRVYEEKILEKLKAYSIDFIVLAGYMRLIKDTILSAFERKIVNIHPADLTKVENKKRAYVGADAVSLALRNNEGKTRSTVIFIDNGIDSGPILVSGPWVAYTGKYPIDQTEIEKHQTRQKLLSDHPAIIKAISILKNKNLFLDEGKIFVDGKLLKPSGYEM